MAQGTAQYWSPVWTYVKDQKFVNSHILQTYCKESKDQCLGYIVQVLHVKGNTEPGITEPV